ncbi:hypothetical protein KGY64_05665 [Candidatus Bipolaricaulota bacterium]|nr:hypothetical protein [Candidatus Bipolaricaulota bacterium]
MKRSTIKCLKDCGNSISEIARQTNHTRKTVRRVLQEPTDKEYERSDMESIVDKHYKEDIKRWIREDIPVKRMCEKCREDEDHPYEGSTSNFYDRVRKLRHEVEKDLLNKADSGNRGQAGMKVGAGEEENVQSTED